MDRKRIVDGSGEQYLVFLPLHRFTLLILLDLVIAFNVIAQTVHGPIGNKSDQDANKINED